MFKKSKRPRPFDYSDEDEDRDDDDDGDEEFDPTNLTHASEPPHEAFASHHARKRAKTVKQPRLPAPAPAPAHVPSSSSSSSSSSLVLAPAQAPAPAPAQAALVNRAAKLRKVLECPVCLKVLYEGRICRNPVKGHNICGICWDSLKAGSGGSAPKCPICRNDQGWIGNGTMDDIVKELYPEEYQHRSDSDWLDLPFSRLCEEIRHKLDPDFTIVANEGTYHTALKHIAAVAKKYDDDLKNPAPFGEAKSLAMQVLDLVHQQDPHRHVACFVVNVVDFAWCHNRTIFMSNFFPRNEVFVARLCHKFWCVVEAPDIID